MIIPPPFVREIVSSRLFVRLLTPDDFHAYKNLRLQALASEDNRFFVAMNPPEHLRTDEDWKRACTEMFDSKGRSSYVAIGAFWQRQQKDVLIGSSLAEYWKGDKKGRTAFYRAIFVDPTFRESGVAERIEKKLDQWSVDYGYQKVLFTIKAEKKRWLKRHITVFGGKIKKKYNLPYVNGEEAPTYLLERSLDSLKESLPKPVNNFYPRKESAHPLAL